MIYDIKSVFGSVVTLLIIMVIGMIAKQAKIITQDITRRLSSILVNITQPLLIVMSLQVDYTGELLKTGAIILLISIIYHIVVAVIALFSYKGSPAREQKVFNIATIFGNCAFMGYPILKAMFGDIGLFYGAFFTFFFNIFIWSYGIYILSRGTKDSVNIKKCLINPGTISSLIGFLLFVLRIKLPTVIGDAFTMVGDMTFPLSMLVVGAVVSISDFKKLLNSFTTYFYLIMKLLMLPVLTLLICVIFKLDVTLIYLCVVMSAMPCATNTVIFAELYKADSKLGARIVSASTILSVGTIPLVLALTNWVISIIG